MKKSIALEKRSVVLESPSLYLIYNKHTKFITANAKYLYQ
jgi:hypothetical protein